MNMCICIYVRVYFYAAPIDRKCVLCLAAPSYVMLWFYKAIRSNPTADDDGAGDAMGGQADLAAAGGMMPMMPMMQMGNMMGGMGMDGMGGQGLFSWGNFSKQCSRLTGS